MFKKFIDQLYNIYEIIFTNISFFSFLYMKFHEPSVKKEINMAEIQHSDKILHIGCGAIPYSLIIFLRNTCANNRDRQPNTKHYQRKKIHRWLRKYPCRTRIRGNIRCFTIWYHINLLWRRWYRNRIKKRAPTSKK